MRGTRGHVNGGCLRLRIIPAYAGNTDHRHGQCGGNRDHPRVCGEHSCDMSVLSMSAGSSPRMRGTPNAEADFFIDNGIIPAYAGNTPCAVMHMSHPRDHPRVCGEHYLCDACAVHR